MIFEEKKKLLVWCDDPPKGRVISMFAGCLANHDHAHNRCLFISTRYMRCHSGFPEKKRHKYSGLRQIFCSDNSGNLLSRETGKEHFFSFFFKYGVFEEPFLHFQLSGVMKVSVRWWVLVCSRVYTVSDSTNQLLIPLRVLSHVWVTSQTGDNFVLPSIVRVWVSYSLKVRVVGEHCLSHYKFTIHSSTSLQLLCPFLLFVGCLCCLSQKCCLFGEFHTHPVERAWYGRQRSHSETTLETTLLTCTIPFLWKTIESYREEGKCVPSNDCNWKPSTACK